MNFLYQSLFPVLFPNLEVSNFYKANKFMCSQLNFIAKTSLCSDDSKTIKKRIDFHESSLTFKKRDFNLHINNFKKQYYSKYNILLSVLK